MWDFLSFRRMLIPEILNETLAEMSGARGGRK